MKKDDLEKIAPRPSGKARDVWDQYVEAICSDEGAALFAEFGIDQPCEWQHFIAQAAHETGGFTILWESGAYSAQGILNTFGAGKHTAAVTAQEAREIAALPVQERTERLFERVYGSGNPAKARELGNTQPGDGWRYRGFGILQTTGRTDHEAYLAGDYTALSALRAALREWDKKGCNELAAKDDLKAITKKINGGYNGLESRRSYLAAAKRYLVNVDVPAVADQPVAAVNPLPKSGTIWGTATGALAGAIAYMDQAMAGLLEWAAKLTELSPVQSALAGMGGNVKSMSLGLGIGAAVYVVSRRVKAAQEGKAG